MYSNNPSRRAFKGSVQIKVSNDRIQLVFSVAGKRHYFSTRLADTPSNRKIAERKAAMIEDDIFKGASDGWGTSSGMSENRREQKKGTPSLGCTCNNKYLLPC